MDTAKIKAKLFSFFTFVRPWLIMIAVIMALKVTGLLSGVSAFANTAILKTGIMDFEPEETDSRGKAFNYNFTVKDLQGNIVDFNTFKGKVVFLNLWATWCGPCRAEMPSIQTLENSLEKDNIVFVMLSLDAPESEGKVVNYIKKGNYTFPVYTIHQGLPEQLQVSSIPTTFIISKDGNIKSKKVGTANYDTDKFRDYLKALATE